MLVNCLDMLKNELDFGKSFILYGNEDKRFLRYLIQRSKYLPMEIHGTFLQMMRIL